MSSYGRSSISGFRSGAETSPTKIRLRSRASHHTQVLECVQNEQLAGYSPAISNNLTQPLQTILTAALGVSGLVMIVEALRRADSAEAIILGVFGMAAVLLSCLIWAK